MEKILDKVDRAIDVETIIIGRIVDACISVVRPYMITNIDGPDPLPTDNPGFFQMVAAVYQQTRGSVGDVNAERIICEWQAEEMAKKDLARQEAMERQVTVEIGEVMLSGGKKPDIVGVDE